MKITKRQLRRIIKEEKQKILERFDDDQYGYGPPIEDDTSEEFQGSMMDLDDYDDLRESLQEFAKEYAHNTGYDPADIINAMKSITGEL